MRISRLIFLIAALATVWPQTASGTVTAPGEWRIYPVYSAPVQKVADTKRYVFVLASGSLTCYDKDKDEYTGLTTDNLLSDTEVSGIFHDAGNDWLLVAYDSGNIDLIDCKGDRLKTYNIPDISHASINGSKRINDVDFDGDIITIAADFGLVRIDGGRRETIESGRYQQAVTGVATTGDLLLIATGEGIYGIAKGKRINSLDNFARLADIPDIVELAVAGDRCLVARTEKSGRNLSTMIIESDPITLSDIRITDKQYDVCGPLILSGSGVVRYVADKSLYEFDRAGSARLLARLPHDMADGATGTYAGESSIWSANQKGIVNYGLSGGNWAIYSDRYRPEALSVKEIAYILPSDDGRRIYLTNLGPTNYRLGHGGDDRISQPQATSMIDVETGEIADVTAWPAPAANPMLTSYQAVAGEYPLSTTRLAEDPDDPQTYWLGTGNDGLYKITGGKLVGRFDQTNSPLPAVWGVRVFDVAFDPEGNMWVAAQGKGNDSGIAMLPADKRRNDPSAVSASDWIVPDLQGYTAIKDMCMLICRRSNMILMTDATPDVKLVAIDTRGTYGDTDDDIVRVWRTFTDQDGKTFDPSRHTSLIEDMDGRVWLGTDMGVVEIADPRQAVNPNMTVTRIKVPRKDGTNTADYLCESDLIYDLTVDHADRKWIATDASGVYLVSPRGDEIIDNFTSDNSMLPFNRVNAVYADALSNTVYMATSDGLAAYGGTASPASDDFEDILIYPNPVRPEYTGMVTISGLMDDSLVKIADASGHVVWQGKSEGGTALWNISDASGRRVLTGVYFVLVSRSGYGISTSGAVAKITVVN